MIPTLWLRAQLGTAWWRRLPDRHFRLLLNLLALATEETSTAQVGGDSDRQVATNGTPGQVAGNLTVVVRMDDLIALSGAPRTTVRRSLQELEERGIAKVATKSGRGSSIRVVFGQFLGENVASFFSPETGENSDTCRSGVPPDPRQVGQFQETAQGKLIQLFPDAPARADLDLLRSPDQDLRSGDLRSPTPRDLKNTDPGMASFPPAAEWPEGHRDADLDRPAAKRTMVDLAQIPERAWAAADYLRAKVLGANGAAVVGTRPWEPGWRWDPGKPAARIGDGSRTGLRVTWATEFRDLHAKVAAAMQNAAADATPEQAWDEISRAVHWLFHGQTGDFRFRVDSPGSLARKWDRIQDGRKRQRERQPRRADGRPDPRARAAIRQWTGDE